MKILTALTYYRPHYSGLTIYAERLAGTLASRGWEVSILTSQYDPGLPASEVCHGVQVLRLPVWLRISKGVIMPQMVWRGWKLVAAADVVHLHVPQLDAALLAIYARLQGKPVVLTYHCDLKLPKGFIHWLANQGSHWANHIAARAANIVVTNTRDYAEHSLFLRHYLDKLEVIPPPVDLVSAGKDDIAAFRARYGVRSGAPVIGMAARLATEKGVEHLVNAMPAILAKHPQARVLFVGQHEDVLGEEAYAASLAPIIERLGKHWQFLGVLPPVEFSSFFHVADVLVLPSINSTESYGMVQVEAMTCGTPVVASDLPGVRQPVRDTGMGEIVPVGDPEAIAAAVIAILDQPGRYQNETAAIKEKNSPAMISLAYEEIYNRLAAGGQTSIVK